MGLLCRNTFLTRNRDMVHPPTMLKNAFLGKIILLYALYSIIATFARFKMHHFFKKNPGFCSKRSFEEILPFYSHSTANLLKIWYENFPKSKSRNCTILVESWNWQV